MSTLLVVITAYAVGVPVASVGVGIAIPALLFYVIYVEDRRSVSPEDWGNQPARTAMVTAYSPGLLKTEIVALVAYESVLVYCVFAPPGRSAWLLLLGQVPFVILALYDRIKRLPAGDSLAVGATWAYIGVFAIVVSTDVVVSSSVALAFVGWFLIVFGGVESRNVDDITGDTDAEKPTLAARLGPRGVTVLESTVKLLGVGLFWTLAGTLAAGMVLGYLFALRSFRLLTRRADRLLTEEGRLAPAHTRGVTPSEHGASPGDEALDPHAAND